MPEQFYLLFEVEPVEYYLKTTKFYLLFLLLIPRVDWWSIALDWSIGVKQKRINREIMNKEKRNLMVSV